ncbi:MAG: ComEC/Rec2 family competence protein [Candidatus Zixiibacteriota bacterium]
MTCKYPSVFILCFIVTGIILADISHLPAWFMLTGVLFFCIVGFLFLNRSKQVIVALSFGISLLFFSGFHFSIKYYDVGINHISRHINLKKTYHIYGEVSDWPDLKIDRTEIKINIDSISDKSISNVSGTILLKISDSTTFLQRGDRLEFYGKIYPVRGSSFTTDFNYQHYLNLKGVFGIVYLPTLLNVRIDKGNRYGIINIVDNFRNYIRHCFYSNLSATSAALSSGFLIGETRDIPLEIYHRFRDSGTLHLLAVSGSNVALVILFFILILRPFSISRKKRALILLGVILIFDLLSYGEPSVMRASIMASLVIAAQMIERRYNLNNIIALAAVIILLFEPAQLFDIGFQLSFAIAWGLIFIIPRLTIYLEKYQNQKLYIFLIFPFLISFVAQICSLGLIALYFHQIPVISPVANLIIVPLVSVAVIGILFLLLANLIFPLLGAFAGSILDMLLNMILIIVEFMGGDTIPLIKINDISFIAVLLFYVFLFSVVWSLKKKSIRKYIIITFLFILNISLVRTIINGFENKLDREINLFSLPGGVAAIIKKGKSKYADLIVTGIAAKKYSLEEKLLYPQLERLGVTKINTLFILSSQYSALDDLIRLIEKYKVNDVYINKYLLNSFKDVFGETGQSESGFTLTSFSKLQANLLQPGYYPSETKLLLNFKNTQILFTDRFPSDYSGFTKKKERILVLGKIWQLHNSDWVKLQRAGFQKIICSKIAQSVNYMDSISPYIPDKYSTDYIYDLSRRGSFTIEINKRH